MMENRSKDSSSQENALRDDEILWLLREGALKEWSVTLSAYLQHFHNYTVSRKDVNFTEVAMLLQNTTSCYSKRVDNVHKYLVEFVDSFFSSKTGNQDDHGGTSRGSKAKSSKSLIKDDLELLPFVVSDNSVRMDSKQHMTTLGPIKKVVFPPPQITSRKPGLTRTLFDVNQKEIGTKDDFGLFGKMSSSGYIGDFDFSMLSEESNSESFDDNSNDVVVQNDDDMDNGTMSTAAASLLRDMAVEGNDYIPGDNSAPQDLMPSDSFVEGPPSPLQDTISHCEIEKYVEKCSAPKTTRKQKDLWEPVPVSELKIPASRPLKVRNTLNAPDSIVNSKEYKEREKVCGKRRKQRTNLKGSLSHECLGFPSFVQWAASRTYKTLNAEKFAVMQERKNKKKLVHKRSTNGEKSSVREAVLPDDQDDEDMDNFDDGNALFDDDDNPGSSEENDVQLAEDRDSVDLMVPTTYEEEAIAVIKKFQESRQAHAADSVEITKRVDQWHQKIRPILEEAETRSAYDSHEYGTRILKSLAVKKGVGFVPFGDVIGHQPCRGEVCRYFLSTLMLANTNNVEIMTDGEEAEADCMKIQLLSSTRHHEQMDEALKDL
ncbi:Protein of unknown function (DUF1032) [Nesidiocoris tenuis]|uniref:Condensin-2 complex subunit H2 C-terminal domain-containing protein n=1 Tax=Nesidiocoris tenuis TaxID=355587 RepID=A0ABN7AF81_9HEMI|nr:Protein of unknown function (DUF1032) [Nesidiocoris tenuis]